MVYESYPWKQDLIKRKRLIQKYNTAEHFNQNLSATYTVIEKALFYSAFIIRKLVDCKGKLSDDANNYSIHVKAIKPLKRVDNLHNWPEEDGYDWKNEKNQTVAGKDVCNWLIHSYLFFLEFEENGPILNFYVSSDYDRNKVLYKISIFDWVNYINFIVSDDIVSLSLQYNEKNIDYRFIRKVRGKIQNRL